MTPQIYRCPVCRESLERQEKAYACGNRHMFDIAKEGYVNLLLAHQKGSKLPGDSKAMAESRSAFLAKGHYDPLADRVDELLKRFLSPQAKILDAGCGEGYFLSRLRPEQPIALWGIDISKASVRLAVKRHKGIQFAVASTYDLPILSSCLDGVLRIFAPADPSELRRVLKPSGCLVTVTPGPDHLFGLKELIYDRPEPHGPEEAIPDGFTAVERLRVAYEIHLTSATAISNLLAMTPYYWHIDVVTQRRVQEREELRTPVDFVVTIYQERQAEDPVAPPVARRARTSG